jgi:hypothetical protein
VPSFLDILFSQLVFTVAQLASTFLAYCFPSKQMLDAEAVASEWSEDDEPSLRDPKPWP